MSDFNFVDGGTCDICNRSLSVSQDECDHGGAPVASHVFRRLHEGRESLVGVKTVPSQKWYMLYDEVGDDWIAYQYLGTREHINTLLNMRSWDAIEDLPREATAIDAPDDIGEADE